jgi:hypothetical protein
MKSSSFVIDQVIGAPEVNQSKGELLHIHTLFPTATKASGEAKGGVVLLKLKKISDAPEVGI